MIFGIATDGILSGSSVYSVSYPKMTPHWTHLYSGLLTYAMDWGWEELQKSGS